MNRKQRAEFLGGIIHREVAFIAEEDGATRLLEERPRQIRTQ